MNPGDQHRRDSRRWPPWADTILVGLTAFVARMAVVLWAAGRIPPTADGDFYHVIAQRVAKGLGYTWLWPDGVVTYAAHYPVGYPAMVGAVYAMFGPHPVAAMVLNALVGTAGAMAVHHVARSATSRGRGLAAGMIAALHVALVAYTPALMTEGIAAALWAIAVWAGSRAQNCGTHRAVLWWSTLGLVVGVATLVRPQSLVMAPALAIFSVTAPGRWTKRLQAAVVACIVALSVCGPWMIRNKLRMHHASISFNGGWNLLIGASAEATGTWSPIQVPEQCKLVFDEAEKDVCFRRAATDMIWNHPWHWLSIAPKKLAATFDYCGAAGWYLHASNPSAFSYDAKVRLGAVETVFQRLLLLACLVTAGWAQGPLRRARVVCAVIAIPMALWLHGYLGYGMLALLLSMQGLDLLRKPIVWPASWVVLVCTMVTHVVFFGAGRYSMLVFPMLAALVGGLLTKRSSPVHTAVLEGGLPDAADRDRGSRPQAGSCDRQ